MRDVVVTEAMVDAGMQELADHRQLEDWRHVLESIYRAMAYDDPYHPASLPNGEAPPK